MKNWFRQNILGWQHSPVDGCWVFNFLGSSWFYQYRSVDDDIPTGFGLYLFGFHIFG